MVPTIASDTEFFTIPDLVEMLGVTPGKIRRLIEDHVLAGLRIDGVLKIPTQFLLDDAPLSPLRGTMLVLLDAGFDNDEAIAWLLEHNDELGESPVASLRAGRKSAVRRATQGLAF